MFEPLFGPARQWGLLVKDLDVAMKTWIDMLGVGPWWGYRNARLQSEFRGQSAARCASTWVSPYRFFLDA